VYPPVLYSAPFLFAQERAKSFLSGFFKTGGFVSGGVVFFPEEAFLLDVRILIQNLGETTGSARRVFPEGGNQSTRYGSGQGHAATGPPEIFVYKQGSSRK